MYWRRWSALGGLVLALTAVVLAVFGGFSASGSTREPITEAYMTAIVKAEDEARTAPAAPGGPAAPAAPAEAALPEEPARPATGTLCKGVVHIGDSTSEGLVDPGYLPKRKLIPAQYARVGAKHSHMDVSGARSIYERYEDEPNAQEAAAKWKGTGFHGCWVIAQATNEAANVAAGSTFTYDDRIDSMMKTIGSEDPVMWVNGKTLESDGYYSEANMRAWDEALVGACDRYPNMRVYDWASEVKDPWFISDGIHFTSEGYAARGRLIANALFTAFPDNVDPFEKTDSSDCRVEAPDRVLQSGSRRSGARPLG